MTACTWLPGGKKEADDFRLNGLIFTGLFSLIVLLALISSGAVALWAGFQDALWPASLPAQLVGFSYVVAGFASLYGAYQIMALRRRAKVPALEIRSQATVVFQHDRGYAIKVVAIAAAASLYIDLTIAFYSFHYKPAYAAVAVALALLSALVARVTLPAIWDELGKGLKTTGLSLAALGAVAQFWYQSVYVPGNTAIGMSYVLSVGPVVQSQGSRFVQLDLTTKDAGSVPALVLASMVEVRELLPPRDSAPAEEVGSVRVVQTINTRSFLFPGGSNTYDIAVKIFNPKVYALRVEIFVDFARTTWLTLGAHSNVPAQCLGIQGFRPCRQSLPSCPRKIQYQWNVVESNLRQFTQGDEQVYSNWSAHPGGFQSTRASSRMTSQPVPTLNSVQQPHGNRGAELRGGQPGRGASFASCRDDSGGVPLSGSAARRPLRWMSRKRCRRRERLPPPLARARASPRRAPGCRRAWCPGSPCRRRRRGR